MRSDYDGTYPRDEILLELEGDGCFPSTGQPGHPDCTSAKSWY